MLRQSVMSLKDKNNLAGNSQILLNKLKNYILFLIFALFFHFHQNLHKKLVQYGIFQHHRSIFLEKMLDCAFFTPKLRPNPEAEGTEHASRVRPEVRGAEAPSRSFRPEARGPSRGSATRPILAGSRAEGCGPYQVEADVAVRVVRYGGM
jgi:hypothetical protein